MVDIRDLVVTGRDGGTILDGVDVSFEEGGIYAIIGPNGAGKSTLVHAVMGSPEYNVAQGSVYVDGKDVTHLTVVGRSKMGFFVVFQEPPPFEALTLGEMLMATERRDVFATQEMIGDYAEVLGLGDNIVEKPLHKSASGGEKKRLELVQIPILQPKYIFFDELTSGVDADSFRIIVKFLKSYYEENKSTYVFITHNKRLVAEFAPKKCFLVQDKKIRQLKDYKQAIKVLQDGYSII